MDRVAVVIFVFNRPAQTAALLKTLEEIRPSHLLVVADGPRKENRLDPGDCAATRQMFDNLGWPCKIERCYSDTNMGLKERFATGLSWAFSRVESAVILEDDCLPTSEFIDFASAMLEKYRSDPHIGMIQGWSPFFRVPFMRGHYLSNRPKVWGWATWRHVVQTFDVEVGFWGDIDAIDLLKKRGYSARYAKTFDKLVRTASEIGTWDYQWVAHLMKLGRKSVAPPLNMIANIGFGEKATHTTFDLGVFSQKAPELKSLRKLLRKSLVPGVILDFTERTVVNLRIIWSLLMHPSFIAAALSRLLGSHRTSKS